MTDVLMPLLGEGMAEGTISRWFVKTGDRVAPGDEIAEVETDKVTMACAAETDGVIEIVVGEGEAVAVGALIARIGQSVPAPVSPRDDSSATGQADVTAVEPETQGAASPAGSRPETTANGQRIRATPLARLVAQRRGVDLAAVTGTGPRGLVTRGDLGVELEPFVRPRAAAPRVVSTPERTLTIPEGATIVELTRAQRVVAERMTEAKATVPDFQVQTDVRMDALIALRSEAKRAAEQAPSLNDFIIKAVACALRDHPQANGFYADGRFVLYGDINVGFAVAAHGALVVPVVRNADQLSIGAIAGETRRLANAVRSGTVAMNNLQGGTFTVSNLGMYGLTAITPIINLPQAAILGVGAAREVVRLDGERPVKTHDATLSLTCDHRILYGADAARFLDRIRELIEQPALLLDLIPREVVDRPVANPTESA